MKYFATITAFLFLSGSAYADNWPSSVSGIWDIVGNQSPGQLQLAQYQGAAQAQCKPIRGTIYGSDSIQGFYCPGSGRIVFMRYSGTEPTQFWSGNLSQQQPGNPLRIGGRFSTFNHNNFTGTSGGSLGEYNFHGTKY